MSGPSARNEAIRARSSRVSEASCAQFSTDSLMYKEPQTHHRRCHWWKAGVLRESPGEAHHSVKASSEEDGSHNMYRGHDELTRC